MESKKLKKKIVPQAIPLQQVQISLNLSQGKKVNVNVDYSKKTELTLWRSQRKTRKKVKQLCSCQTTSLDVSIITPADEKIFHGESVCSPDDKFSSKEGKKHALQKALKEANVLSDAEKAIIWQAVVPELFAK